MHPAAAFALNPLDPHGGCLARRFRSFVRNVERRLRQSPRLISVECSIRCGAGYGANVQGRGSTGGYEQLWFVDTLPASQ
jgi:hypothetical protein